MPCVGTFSCLILLYRCAYLHLSVSRFLGEGMITHRLFR